MTRVLNVYMQDTFVGKLEQAKDGTLTFTYDDRYLRDSLYGISISMPLRSQSYNGEEVKSFFSGLLPEESIRTKLARYLGLSDKNPFSLLEVIGGDCAGALALYPEGQAPQKTASDIEVLSDKRLREIIDLMRNRPMLAGADGYRLSLAGAQDKLAVGYQDNHVTLIKGGNPTTHILKPIIERVQDSAHNELFCMKLASRIGIDTPNSSIHFVENQPFYLVERFDRQRQITGAFVRIHQEDFCQAMGIAPEIKYEREGGPSIANCLAILSKYSAQPALDHIRLLNIVVFNYLIGNADAHGKNFSLLYKKTKPELAPAYDLLSTAIYSELSDKMAMKIGGKYKPHEIYLRHFLELVGNSKTAQSAFRKQIKNLISKLSVSAKKLREELTEDGLSSPVYDEIIKIINKRSNRLQEY